jgi:dTDP-4-dehydrorhamnose 3,5-epimerase
LYDVIVDLRKDSRSYKRHIGALLTPDNGKMLYAPEGFAHGFLTLEDRTEVFYQISQFYSPSHAKGFRWDDPAFSIAWPSEAKIISERDRSYPNFNE